MAEHSGQHMIEQLVADCVIPWRGHAERLRAWVEVEAASVFESQHVPTIDTSEREDDTGTIGPVMDPRRRSRRRVLVCHHPEFDRTSVGQDVELRQVDVSGKSKTAILECL